MGEATYRWTDAWRNKMTVPIRTDNDYKPGSLRWKIENALINNILQDTEGGITHTPLLLDSLIGIVRRFDANKKRVRDGEK